MRVFITGATGFLGRAITLRLLARGDQVVAVTRDAARAARRLDPAVELVQGDPTEAGAWQQAVRGCDAVINLAGEPIGARRWNAQIRQILLHSRVDVTRQVVDAIAAAGDDRPEVLVTTSGIDYYCFAADLPDDEEWGEDELFDERSPASDSFLGKLCMEWEQEARSARQHGVRVCYMRLGVVLDRSAGALPRMISPFKWFVGGPLGTGRQWVSWIHLNDVVGAYLFALDESELRGPVNVVAPEPVRQRAFAAALGNVLGRPSRLRVPARLLPLAAGQLAEYLLNGRRASPRALTEAGYEFTYPSLGCAFDDIFS